MDTELLKGTLSLLILSLLQRKAMYGYEIAATVHKDTAGAFTFKEGSLYPSLHKLEAEGLIVGQWEEAPAGDGGEGGTGGGRKRRYYHLTPKGKGALREKVDSWNELVKAVSAVLEKRHG
jgi:DNA-binding PadR family transcriptional regulator